MVGEAGTSKMLFCIISTSIPPRGEKEILRKIPSTLTVDFVHIAPLQFIIALPKVGCIYCTLLNVFPFQVNSNGMDAAITLAFII